MINFITHGIDMPQLIINRKSVLVQWIGSVAADYGFGVGNINYILCTDEEILEYLTAPIKAHPDLPFFIYAASGGMTDGPWMREQIKLITEHPAFSYGPDPAKNNIYYALSDYYHTDYLVPYYYWNSLKVLFKN